MKSLPVTKMSQDGKERALKRSGTSEGKRIGSGEETKGIQHKQKSARNRV